MSHANLLKNKLNQALLRSFLKTCKALLLQVVTLQKRKIDYLQAKTR